MSTLSPGAQAVADYVRRTDHVSFVQIRRVLEQAGIPTKGSQALSLGDPNLILWAGVSDEFAAVVTELHAAKAIHPVSTSVLTYLAEGCMLSFPLAKRPPKGGYREEHWAPVLFRPGRGPGAAR
jgi:hypothetical protein